jgi:anti-anti-sigma regulatory factor
MPDCTITTERTSDRVTFRVGGVFDRGSAWDLREKLEREGEREVLVDFSLVRDFSDLGVAVLAHALAGTGRRVALRGLRQHQLRIFRYCGLPVEELSAREAVSPAS